MNVRILLLSILSLGSAFALHAQNSDKLHIKPYRVNQHREVLDASFGVNYTDAGSSILYHDTTYTSLRPDFGLSAGLNFEFHQRASYYFTDRLIASFDRLRTAKGHAMFVSIGNYLNVGYKPADILSVEAGMGLDIPLFYFSNDSLLGTMRSEAEFVPLYDFAVCLHLSRNIGLNVHYAHPFKPVSMYVSDDTKKETRMLNKYRPATLLLSLTINLRESQKLILNQDRFLKY